MGTKTPKVETKLCSICSNKTAVETDQAYLAYYSKYYSKLRKAKKNSAQHRAPQVGKIGTVEEAMLSEDFGAELKKILPRLALFPRDSIWLDRLIYCLMMLFAVWLTLLGVDLSLVYLALLAVIFIMVEVESSLFSRHLDKYFLFRPKKCQWFCLQCGRFWIENKFETKS